MTKQENERGSRWIRVSHALCPGLYAYKLIAPGPRQRAALLALYDIVERRVRRGRRQQREVAR
jgi:hypothetical protein